MKSYDPGGGGGSGSAGIFLRLTLFDDEHGFVIDAIGFAGLPQPIVALHGIVENCIADFFGTTSLVFAKDLFDPRSVFLVVTVIDSIRVEKQNVARTH